MKLFFSKKLQPPNGHIWGTERVTVCCHFQGDIFAGLLTLTFSKVNMELMPKGKKFPKMKMTPKMKNNLRNEDNPKEKMTLKMKKTS